MTAAVRRRSAVEGDGVSLREYVDLRLSELEKLGDQRATLLLRSIEQQFMALDEWKHNTNAYRDQLREQATTFLPRREYDLLETRLRDLERTVVGRASFDSEISAMRAAIEAMNRTHNTRLSNLETPMATLLVRLSIICG